MAQWIFLEGSHMTTTHIEKQNITSTPENPWHFFQLIPLHPPHINHYPDFKYHI